MGKKMMFGVLFVAGFLLPSALEAFEGVVEPHSLPLYIPPLAEDLDPATPDMDLELVARQGKQRFLAEIPLITYGYNSEYLGPTIRMKRGQKLNLSLRNKLEQETSIYWHGLRIPGDAHGGPWQVVPAEGTWETSFTVDQPAATLWYHPQIPGKTGKQVYKGLTGLFLVDDEEEGALPLPREYGVNDIPLILQDRRLDDYGDFLYVQDEKDKSQGIQGDLFLVNGVPYPYLEAGQGMLRLRVLNASNSSVYRIFVPGETITMIASDGGLLSEAVTRRHFVLTPGERGEFLLDLGGAAPGEEKFFFVENLKGQIYEAMKINVLPPSHFEEGMFSPGPGIKALTETLASALELPSTKKKRSFVLESRGSRHTINNRDLDLKTINEKVRGGTTEIWEIRHGGRGAHTYNFHVQGLSFYLLERNESPPDLAEAGPKDTLALSPGESVRIILSFGNMPGKFLYTSQFLEYADAGMMGQFQIFVR